MCRGVQANTFGVAVTVLDNRNDLRDWKGAVLDRVNWRLSRREFVRAAAVGAAGLAVPGALPGRAPAETPNPVKTGTFYFPRLMFHVRDGTGHHWNAGAVGDVILRRRLRELTNVNVSQDRVVVRGHDLESMCRYPFVFMTSEGYFKLPDDEEKNVREFLLRGGFIHADDCVYQTWGDRFFTDYVKMINRLFPDNPMREVPKTHEIYRCYFKFPDGAPQIREARNKSWGLFEKGTGRIMTYCTAGDLHCGWTCVYFPKDRNEAAIRMGINIIIYYLTH